MNNMAFTKLSYGVYVATSWKGEGKPTGCVANSAMQVTSSPATVAISINHDNFTNECIKKSGRFAVNILGENSDPLIIGNFGFKSGRDNDKFTDTPVIKDFLPIVDGAIAEILSDDEPMTYSYYHKVIKGKAPKNAPTYIKE